MSTQLINALKPNKTYTITLDLSRSENWGHYGVGQWVSYTNPAELEVFLEKNQCDQTLKVWSSPSIHQTSWETYSFTYTPNDDFFFLLLAVNWDGDDTYFGKILIDNIKIAETSNNPNGNSACTTSTENIPNIFTPNNDGKNDLFSVPISEELNLSKINTSIYNRWGNLVYTSNDSNFQWNGNNVTDGMYYWVTHYTCIAGNTINKKSLYGWVHLVR